MALTLVVPPSGDVIAIPEMRMHLKVDDVTEDPYITALMQAAVMHVETVLRRKLLTQRWRLTLNRFGRCIELPFPPVQAVNSIKYRDDAGILTTMQGTQYQVALSDIPALVMPVYSGSWPSTESGRLGAVEVEFTVGYGTAEQIPHPIRHAVRLLTAHWYANREGVEVGQGIVAVTPPMGIDALLWPYRDFAFA